MNEDERKFFVDLVYQNINIILKICNIYSENNDREDMKQEIIYQLWKSYPAFKGKSKFQTWMYRVALNTALLSFRKKKLNYSEIPADEIHIPDDINEDNELQSRVKELYNHIAKFNDLDKAITFLYIEQCSYQEISEITGINGKNVSVRLVRIKDKLRKMFNTQKI